MLSRLSVAPVLLALASSCADGTLPSSKGPDDPTNPRAAEAAYVPAGAFERRLGGAGAEDAGSMQQHDMGAHAGHTHPASIPSSTSSAPSLPDAHGPAGKGPKP